MPGKYRQILTCLLIVYIRNSSCDDKAVNSGSTGGARKSADTEDFYELRTEVGIYVDKSLFIKEYLNSPEQVVIIARPKGFGKSVTLNMLKRFFEIPLDNQRHRVSTVEKTMNHRLFAGGKWKTNANRMFHLKPLKIYDSKYSMYYQGRFPVISLKFENVVGDDYAQIERLLIEQIRQLYREFDYLTKSNDSIGIRTEAPTNWRRLFDEYRNGRNVTTEKLKNSVPFLSELLRGHYKMRVQILIDDYDVPIIDLIAKRAKRLRLRCSSNVTDEALFNEAAQSDQVTAVISLMSDMLTNALKFNDALFKAALAGTMILRLIETLRSGAVFNVIESYLLSNDKFGAYFGFSQTEVNELLPNDGSNTTSSRLSELLQRQYGGYNVSGEHLYRPHSIVRYLTGGNPDSMQYFWNDGPGTFLADAFLLSDHIQPRLHAILEGTAARAYVNNEIRFDTITRTEVLNSLLHSGYLTVAEPAPHFEWNLTVPNVEMGIALRGKTMKWLCDKLKLKSVKLFGTYRHLLQLNMDQFRTDLEEILSVIPDRSGIEMETYHTGIMQSLVRLFGTGDYTMFNVNNSRSGESSILIVPVNNSTDGTAIAFNYRSSTTTAKNARSDLETLFQQICIQRFGQIREFADFAKRVLRFSIIFCDRKLNIEHRIQATSK